MLLVLAGFPAHAQKAMGFNNPATSTALDVTSTKKGLLIPRMTSLQRTAIAFLAAGLEVDNTK